MIAIKPPLGDHHSSTKIQNLYTKTHRGKITTVIIRPQMIFG